MQGYESKEGLIVEIEKTAALFIGEFMDVAEDDKDKLIGAVDRTPAQMIAYQLGWLDLIMAWDRDEAEGKRVVTPCEGYKWNNLGGLYQSFYDRFSSYSLAELRDLFKEKVQAFIQWLDGFTEDEVFKPGSRKWASSTPSNWPVRKWVHINTVAPFKSIRSKIRKWKKLNATGQSKG
ncbi:MAG: ClbS/DfsB family four-helix bundle protein [Firmicutes bacterium]|nr:ClbS/DfsB family four-helix bundle protein [Bacillota bacterium]